MSRGATRRQEIVQRLGEGEWSFEGLRHALQVSVRTLEDDLRHVERNVRRGPQYTGEVVSGLLESKGDVFATPGDIARRQKELQVLANSRGNNVRLVEQASRPSFRSCRRWI